MVVSSSTTMRATRLMMMMKNLYLPAHWEHRVARSYIYIYIYLSLYIIIIMYGGIASLGIEPRRRILYSVQKDVHVNSHYQMRQVYGRAGKAS